MLVAAITQGTAEEKGSVGDAGDVECDGRFQGHGRVAVVPGLESLVLVTLSMPRALSME